MAMMPRDPTQLTVYGRKPVLEALADPKIAIARVIVAHGASGEVIERILALAAMRQIPIKRLPLQQLNRISRNARQDQGVAADIAAPLLGDLAALAARAGQPGRLRLIALDGITTQENAGMILRSAAAAGLEGAIMADFAGAKLDPRVLKASAGTALKLPIYRAPRIEQALATARAAGLAIIGLDGHSQNNLFQAPLPDRLVLVIGNESTGLSEAARQGLTERCAIPLAPGIESLNAACAATLACFEIKRRV